MWIYYTTFALTIIYIIVFFISATISNGSRFPLTNHYIVFYCFGAYLLKLCMVMLKCENNAEENNSDKNKISQSFTLSQTCFSAGHIINICFSSVNLLLLALFFIVIIVLYLPNLKSFLSNSDPNPLAHFPNNFELKFLFLKIIIIIYETYIMDESGSNNIIWAIFGLGISGLLMIEFLYPGMGFYLKHANIILYMGLFMFYFFYILLCYNCIRVYLNKAAESLHDLVILLVILASFFNSVFLGRYNTAWILTWNSEDSFDMHSRSSLSRRILRGIKQKRNDFTANSL